MFDRCIYFNLVTLTRKITKIWQNAFGRLGLAPSMGYILFAIAESKDTTQKDLKEIMELDPSTLSRFVDTLVAKGLVEKSAKGKGAILSLTKDGEKTYKKVSEEMDHLYATMQDHFGKSEFKGFVQNLQTAKLSFEDNDK